MRNATAALAFVALACLSGAAAGQTGPRSFALADPVLVLDRDDPAIRRIDRFREAVQSGLSRGCREVVGAGSLAAIVAPAALGANLKGAYDRPAVGDVLTRLHARYLVIFAVRREKGGYRVVGAALDPFVTHARIRRGANVGTARQLASTLRRLAERIARLAGCPRWRGKIALTRTIEVSQHDQKVKVSDTSTEIEAITYEFGAGSPKFTATLEGKLKSIRRRGNVTITRNEEMTGEGEGFVHRAHAYVRVEPDGRYWFVLGQVPVKTAWQRNLCHDPGKCEEQRGEKTIHISGLNLSGKAPPSGTTFKGSRVIKRVGHITEKLTWELIRTDR